MWKCKKGPNCLRDIKIKCNLILHILWGFSEYLSTEGSEKQELTRVRLKAGLREKRIFYSQNKPLCLKLGISNSCWLFFLFSVCSRLTDTVLGCPCNFSIIFIPLLLSLCFEILKYSVTFRQKVFWKVVLGHFWIFR